MRRILVTAALVVAMIRPAQAADPLIEARGAVTRCFYKVAMDAQEPGYPVDTDFGDKHQEANKIMNLVQSAALTECKAESDHLDGLITTLPAQEVRQHLEYHYWNDILNSHIRFFLRARMFDHDKRQADCAQQETPDWICELEAQL